MQIDCRNLDCPMPVIKTKEALQILKIGQSLEILVNSIASRENIKRFLTSNSFEFEVSENLGETTIKTIKTSDLSDQNTDNYNCEIPIKRNKIVYLNDDKAGSGDVGQSLLSKFLGAIVNLEDKPSHIICVNNAVLMATNRGHISFSVLKNLESLGIEILVCGSCLEAYKLVDKLAIGRMTNAYEVMDLLSKNEVIKL